MAAGVRVLDALKPKWGWMVVGGSDLKARRNILGDLGWAAIRMPTQMILPLVEPGGPLGEAERCGLRFPSDVGFLG
jgi:hypothetical protein